MRIDVINQHHSEIPNASVVYVPLWIRCYVRSIQPDTNKHPMRTHQGFDFNMNLGVYYD